MTNEKNIIDSCHLGIVNHHITCGVPYENVGTVSGFWAPPFTASDCRMELLIDGAPIPAASWKWYPFRFSAEGEQNGIAAVSDYVLAAGIRAGLMKISLTNCTAKPRTISAEILFPEPHLNVSDVWEFPTEISYGSAETIQNETSISFVQKETADPPAVIFAESPSNPPHSEFGKFCLTIPAGETAVIRWTAVFEKRDKAEELSADLSVHWEERYQESLTACENDLEEIYRRLPSLESENAALVHLYDRSLIHFFTNRWDVEEFLLHPYFGTGSMLGGCLCCYLWNYGEPWEIMQLYDPAASRAHIKQFLSIDLSEHFAFRPTSGIGVGPWYMINQEKILGHIYYYVLLTGDKSFLNENVGGRPIWEHVKEQALKRDDISQPVTLIDYGDSNSHLELRRAKNLYNHVMPDLNGRRYDNYMRGSALLEWAGHPDPSLAQRSAELKKLLKEKLWNPDTRWFDFINDQNQLETRWTIQMYKLIGSGVLDSEETAGLVSHWNEEEFLGAYGVHSLAKGDPWYDPADIDNGGPGACTDFGPQIAERFYKAGYPELGNDVIKRILWLGERMPYWGDSVTAGTIDYRRDTPLQCMFDSVTIAQTIIFGMFGISALPDGSVVIAPARADFAPNAVLRNVRIRGLCFDVELNENGYTVICGGQRYQSEYGKRVILPPAEN